MAFGHPVRGMQSQELAVIEEGGIHTKVYKVWQAMAGKPGCWIHTMRTTAPWERPGVSTENTNNSQKTLLKPPTRSTKNPTKHYKTKKHDRRHYQATKKTQNTNNDSLKG